MRRDPQTESPFMAKATVRLGFGTVMLLLLTVVGAGIGLLIYNAIQVPAITSEFNAWLGRPVAALDSGSARRAQVVFALFVYTAPLGLGIIVCGLHYLLNWLDQVTRQSPEENDDEFRM